MKLSDSRWVNVVWCDDVRQEVGNKPSLMGVYTAGLVVPGMPFVLPRLAAWINVCTPKGRPFKKLAVRIKRGDSEEPMAAIEVEELQPEQVNSVSQVSAELGEPSALIMSFVVLLGPIQLQETTQWFKVFVETEDEMLESFKLPVKAAPAGAVQS